MSFRWQEKRVVDHHADDWLITYADVITLLLCFFVIMVIAAAPKKHVGGEAGALPQVEQPRPIPPPLPLLSPQAPLPRMMDIFPGNLPFHDVGPEDFPKEREAVPAIAAHAEVEAEAPAVALVSDSPAPPLPPAPVDSSLHGDMITTMEMDSSAFFDSGSAVLSPAGMSILRDVAVSLASEAFINYQITVEGHTDDTPIHTAQFPSNWELSAARAAAVVRFLLERGIPAQRLRAAGYADSQPKAPNREAGGSAILVNQAMNRRVVIKLEKIEKK